MTRQLLVIGDALLDEDLQGQADRLCPDSAGPVVEVVEATIRPGGAALAATLAAADPEVEVTLVAPQSTDEAGGTLRRSLPAQVQVVDWPDGGSTSVKQRIRVHDRTVIRVDRGSGPALDVPLPIAVRELLAQADAVLVSDYGLGTTKLPELRQALTDRPRGCSLVWDPHPRGGRPLRGSRLVTPNAREARQAVISSGHPDQGDGLAAMTAYANDLHRRWDVGALVVTMGSRGCLLSYGEPVPLVVPSPVVVDGDACGAGDMFAATVARRLALGDVIEDAITFAVATAGRFLAAGGVASVGSPAEGASWARHPVPDIDRQPRIVATGGCFDLLHSGHLATLRAARSLGDRLVVCLNSDASVRRLKGPHRPAVPEEERRDLLLALDCVDEVILFDEDTPERVLNRIRPQVWVKGGDYAGAVLEESRVVAAWGGQTVVVPYLDGYSTTSRLRSFATTERFLGSAS